MQKARQCRVYRCNLLETAALSGISASTGHQIRVFFLYDCLSTWLQSGTYFRTKKRAEAHRLIIRFFGLMYHKVTFVLPSRIHYMAVVLEPEFS
jgi:hypothetical protein